MKRREFITLLGGVAVAMGRRGANLSLTSPLPLRFTPGEYSVKFRHVI